MTIPSDETPQILEWLVKERQNYDYWPKGAPVDRNGNRIPDGWNNKSLVNPNYDAIRKSQRLLKTICYHLPNARTPEEKADAILLVRYWKTNRRSEKFAEKYCGKISDLTQIWEKARQIANNESDFKELASPEIGIAVASSFVTAISSERKFGILDTVMASVWEKNGWIKFHIRPRSQGAYLCSQKNSPNWKRYSKYVLDLKEICNAANKAGLTFIDPLDGEQKIFTAHDVEMAFFQHYK